MKLAKLSLAAIVAAGALTTVSAQPLEEAIKGVEVSGFMRYRYYNDSENTNTANDAERHRFSAPITFIAPVAENITAGVTVSVERSEYAANATNGTDDVTMSKFWFKYAAKDFSVKMGKQEIASPWTEGGYGGTKGTGALAMYTGVPGWAFAGAAFASTSGIDAIDAIAAGFGQENLYAVAAIGAVGPVNLQVWAAKMTNLFEYSVFAQADFKMAGFGFKAQVNQLKVEDSIKTDLGLADDTGLFWGAEGSYATDAFNVALGYYSNDKDQPVYTLDPDDGAMLKFGQQLYGEVVNQADVDTIYAVAGTKMGKVGFEAGYGQAKQKNGTATGDLKIKEFYGLVSYAYSKNFKLSAYYSDMSGNDDLVDPSLDNNEFRFEAKYSF